MFSVKTDTLKKAADQLKADSVSYSHRISALENCINWLKNQDMKEKEDLRRVLLKQTEELEKQQRELETLGQALEQISSLYDTTEEKIADSKKAHTRRVRIQSVNLTALRAALKKVGIRLEQQEGGIQDDIR